MAARAIHFFIFRFRVDQLKGGVTRHASFTFDNDAYLLR